MGVRKVQAAETEAALLDAARRLFAERGYLSTKITDITGVAGRATGSFYQHFASKEELLEALRADMYVQGSKAMTGEVQLREHLAVAWQVMSDNHAVVAALFEAAVASGPASGALWQQMAGGTAVFREHLEYLRDQGRELPGDPVLVAAVMGGIMSLLAYTRPPGYSAGAILDTLTALLLHGLAGRPQPG
jgi:AcrR family transcriptional regulator